MIKRTLGICLVAVLPMALLAGCGGSDSADSTTTLKAGGAGVTKPAGGTAATKPAEDAAGEPATTPDSGSDMSVDEFCTKAKELAGLVRDVKENKDLTKMKEMTQLSTELAGAAQKLGAKITQDPSLAQKYSECTKDLPEIAGSN